MTVKIKTKLLAAGMFLAASVNGFGQPVISKEPANQTASLFADATFRLTANGDAPLSYEWRFNDAELIGMTNRTLTITNVQHANAGDYEVVVTNPSGSVISQVATLTITRFNSIYCFGFSWTDTGNCVWDPVQYWHNHGSNGPMWPEFLSTNLGLAYVQANNYAHCGATGPDILAQVINFPAPPKPQLSLYCLWADGPDVDFPTMVNALTNEVAGNRLLQASILDVSNSVHRLYNKGARQIVIENRMDAGQGLYYVEIVGTNTALLAKLSEYFARFNASVIDAVSAFSETRPDLRIVSVDIFSKLDEVRANAAQYGFTKATIDALNDTNLTDKSFTGPGADYMFWDGHPTSKLHKLIAAWHLDVLTNSVLEKLEARIASGSPNIQMNRLQIGRDYTLQKSTELKTWTDVQTFTASAGTNQWSSSLGNDSTAYFRLKWQR